MRTFVNQLPTSHDHFRELPESSLGRATCPSQNSKYALDLLILFMRTSRNARFKTPHIDVKLEPV